MTEPRRIQLRRAKGWRKPTGAIVVSRPSKWGNPWRVGDGDPFMTREMAIRSFKRNLLAGGLPFTVADVRAELRGRDLACWCKSGAPCHADVLLELANRNETKEAPHGIR